MKNIFVILLMFVGVYAFGQSYTPTWRLDTLANAETETWTADKLFHHDGYVGVYSVADSLSGATAATIYYEGSNDNTNWFILGTDTIDGVQSLNSFEGLLYTRYFRVRVVSTGTQSTKFRPTFCWKPDK